MSRVHLMISGFVQGVGFRHFVRNKAQELGVTGWVSNTSNGMVELMAEGEKEKLEELIKSCKEGPMLSEVKDVSIDWQESPPASGAEFSSFEIK